MKKALTKLFWYAMVVAGLSAFFLSEAKGQTIDVQTEIVLAAQEANFDPNLALAIAKVESNFNPNAIGALGEIGLFQLRPEFHPAVRPGDVRGNVRIAVRYLAYLRRRCAATYGDAWFTCYSYGPNKKGSKQVRLKSEYYRRVMAAYYEATHEI